MLQLKKNASEEKRRLSNQLTVSLNQDQEYGPLHTINVLLGDDRKSTLLRPEIKVLDTFVINIYLL